MKRAVVVWELSDGGEMNLNLQKSPERSKSQEPDNKVGCEINVEKLLEELLGRSLSRRLVRTSGRAMKSPRNEKDGVMEHAIEERGKKKEKKGDANGEEPEDGEENEEGERESVGFEEGCADERKSGEECEEDCMEHAMEDDRESVSFEKGKKKEKKDCEEHEEHGDRESVGFEKDWAEEWKSVGKNLRCGAAPRPRRGIRGPRGGEATAEEQRRG